MAWPSRHRGSSTVAVLLAGLAAVVLGCDRRQLVQGECSSLNGSDVCVWHEMDGNTLTAFGATVPMGAIENGPADAPMVWPPVPNATIPLPEMVKSATGLDNLTLFWEAHGHPPGPFATPHFDFHFNNASSAELQGMDCSDTTKPSALPAGYELPDVPVPQLGTLVGLCVPNMGMHAMPGADVHRATPFEQAMVVGYYSGRAIFVEPMISRATLLQRRSFDLEMPAVTDVPAGVRYPSRFRADYDSTTQSYRFVFSDFGGATGR
jgi:hypothetical protein